MSHILESLESEHGIVFLDHRDVKQAETRLEKHSRTRKDLAAYKDKRLVVSFVYILL